MDNSILDIDLGGAKVSAGLGAALRNNAGRARTAIVMLWIMFGIDICMVIFYFTRWRMVSRALDGDLVTYNEARTSDIVESMLAVFYMIALIITAVMFIRWFRRAYYNLHQVDGSYLTYTEGWASGAWFIPIFNWFGPYRIMKEICQDTTHHVEKTTGNTIDTGMSLLGIWWGIWITEGIMSRVISLINSRNVHILHITTILTIVTFLMDLAAALLVLNIIRKISNAETAMYNNRGSLSPFSPAQARVD
jgi:hypothetical protein